MGGRSSKLDIRSARRRSRLMLMAALTLGLSGCLVSEDPLISPSEAAFPLPDRMSAERFSPKGQTEWEHDAYESAYRSGSGYIVVHEDKTESSEITLKRIAQNTFLAQLLAEDGNYTYALLVIDGNTIYRYAPDCDDFTAADMQRFGIEKNPSGDDCTVTSAQGLAAAYLAYLRSGIRAGAAYVLR